MENPCCNTDPSRNPPELNFDEVAELCKALGHPARVRLLKHLIDYGSCYFGNLSDVLPLAASTVSQHVTILKEAGLIIGTSDEQRMCYCINKQRLSQLKALISGL
ncbi:MAG: transcriptional regulator [Burkholderiales bacterium RIFCSPLOWO2_02_FULL_57_36]|nr:MAG: transcriptional regulator [Burkholderiales bacterium RIFCSPLOWO2_02_FULL_57_36]